MSRQWWDTVLLCLFLLSGSERSCLDWMLGPIVLSNLRYSELIKRGRQAEFVRSNFNKGFFFQCSSTPVGQDSWHPRLQITYGQKPTKQYETKNPVCAVTVPGTDSHHLSSLQSVLDQCSVDRYTLSPKKQEKQVGMWGAFRVYTHLKKSNQSSDSPVPSKPSRDSTNLRVAWGYVHRWWRAGRTFHLPFGSCHLTEKTNFPPWKGGAITLFRGNCRLRCKKSLDKSLMSGRFADG